MNHATCFAWKRIKSRLNPAGRTMVGMLFWAGTAVATHAQGQIASGTISSSGTGPYVYSLTFSDAANATAPIGSIWYAWVPGAFYLPGPPAKAASPPGWTANVSGHSIQWVANALADDIKPGQTLSGFSYQASFSPAQLAAAFNSGVSVAYSGGLVSDSGNTFTVRAVAAPEPSIWALLGCGSAGLLCMTRIGRRSKRAAAGP